MKQQSEQLETHTGKQRNKKDITVIVNSTFLKHYSKAKCRAPAYSRLLCQVRWVVQRCQANSTFGCQRDQKGRQAGFVEDKNTWKAEDWMEYTVETYTERDRQECTHCRPG